LHGELELLEPRTWLVAAALTPDERTLFGVLEDRRDHGQRQIELLGELRVVSELVGIVAVLDGTEDPAEIDVARRGRVNGRNQIALTLVASSPLRPGATSNSTCWPSSSDL